MEGRFNCELKSLATRNPQFAFTVSKLLDIIGGGELNKATVRYQNEIMSFFRQNHDFANFHPKIKRYIIINKLIEQLSLKYGVAEQTLWV